MQIHQREKGKIYIDVRVLKAVALVATILIIASVIKIWSF